MMKQALWVRTACTDPYENLAREDVLMQSVRPGECILYLWQNRHTVVIGRNQECWKECNVEALEADSGRLARRLSGGGAVYHDLGNLNFTFILCKQDFDVTRQLSVVVEACRLLGIRAEISGRNDLTVDGKKVSGNAFYISAGRCCHHGTLLLQSDLEQMERFLNVPQDKLQRKGVLSVHARVGNLGESCPGLTADQMCELLVQAFGTVYGLPAEPFPEKRLDVQAVADRRVFYASDLWRLSQKRPANLVLSHRFGWGDFQLYAAVRSGVLSGVRVYSDALDSDFINRLPRALEGIRFSVDAIAEAIATVKSCPQISADISAYLKEAAASRRKPM